MAKAKKPTPQNPGDIIIQNLVIRAANRRKSDIQYYRDAHRQAEQTLGTGTRINLYDLYDDTSLDAHLSSLIDKRIMSITNHKLRFVRDNKDVEEVQKVIRTNAFRTMLREMMLAQFWGISVIEVEKATDGTIHVWSIPRKHIRPRTQRIVKEQWGTENDGINYREGVYLNTCIEVGTKDGLGLLLKAVPYVIYKRGCWGDWAQYSEVFGMPTKIGRYDGYDENTRIALESALDEAGSALSIVIPKEAQIEFLESKSTSNSGTLYKDLSNACDEQLSILVLGNTETTKSSSSSGYAQSTTHQQQQQQIAEDDRAFMLGYLETEVRRVFSAMGFPMEGGEWQWAAEQENISLKDRVNIDITLRNAGIAIDDDYFYETYGVPKPTKTVQKKPQEATKQLAPDSTVTLTLQDLTDFFGFASPTK